jgi:hypothetical protein
MLSQGGEVWLDVRAIKMSREIAAKASTARAYIGGRQFAIQTWASDSDMYRCREICEGGERQCVCERTSQLVLASGCHKVATDVDQYYRLKRKVLDQLHYLSSHAHGAAVRI